MRSPRRLRPLFPSLGLAAVLCAAGAPAALAATVVGEASTFEIHYLDGPAEGFHDPGAPLAGQTDNPGASLGEQRRLAFEYATAIFADLIVSGTVIEVEVFFDPLGPCGTSSGPLGGAIFNTVHRDWVVGTPPPLANTWYPQALANAFSGTDLDGTERDLYAEFNSSVGVGGCLTSSSWYYGLDALPGPSSFDFVTVALHELAHGLGFATIVSLSSGTKFAGFDDAYMTHLEDHSLGATWPGMSDAERSTSAKDNGDLHWLGANVLDAGAALVGGKDANGHVRMYAPGSLQLGSSVSHFDTTLAPNELMEPFLSGPIHDLGLTGALLADIGWSLRLCGNGLVDPGEECDDGNDDPFDGCTNQCTICGDGVETPPEECDDGDLIDNDGCDSNCTLPVCGNQVVNPGEECDDGNGVDTDGCKNDCTFNVCGDGVPHAGVEECDDGNLIDGDGCDSNCTLTACGNGIVTAGEECDDANDDPADGCTNWCTVCGDGIATPPEQCDDGNLADGDGCEASCVVTGQLPQVDYTPSSAGRRDSASVACLKVAGIETIRFADRVYGGLRKCLGALTEREARIAAALSPTSVAAAEAAAMRHCVEPSASAPDPGTMLGRIAAAEIKATSAIERRCGTPGATTVDGRTIGSSASGDFTTVEIEDHLRRVRCEMEGLIGRGYATAAADLSTLNARPSQGGLSLDQSFPCLGPADLPPVDLSGPPEQKDARSVRCQGAVGIQVAKLLAARHKLIRGCLGAIQEHTARVSAGMAASQIQSALAAAVRKCVEPSPSSADRLTLLGRLETAETLAVSSIERSCGTPGALTVDGRLIGQAGSADFLTADVEAHAAEVGCRVDTLLGLTFNGAASDLSAFDARPSQGGASLDQSFPCMVP